MSLYVDIEKRLGAFRLQSKFEVADETLALLGASGCGKSVTLKCIAGIMTPDRGRIVLNGRVLFDSEKKIDLTPQQRRVGYLFQQYALFPNMTVEQNILCGIREGRRSEKRALAAEKLRMFRLEGLEKKYPAQLSGGQQQRVALARILCSEPQAILLDEPFSALDSYLKWNLELELSDLLAGFRGPILWVPRPGGMLPQLSKGLRDGKRRFLSRDGHGDAGAPSRHAERSPADRLPQFPAGAPLRGRRPP